MKTYLVPIREFSCGNFQNRVDVRLSRIERRKRFFNFDDYGYPVHKYLVEVNAYSADCFGNRKLTSNGITKYFEFYSDAIRLYEATVKFIRTS